MDTRDQIGPQCLVECTVPVDAGQRRKAGRTDQHVEMRLAALAPAAMATVAFTIIDDFKPGRGETGGEAVFNFIRYRHIRAPLHIGPSICRNKPYSLASESERPS